jgi:hypothetical protein
LIALQLGGLGHERLGPGALEQPRQAGLVCREVRQRTGRTRRPALEASSHIAGDAVEEGAKAGHATGPGSLQSAALPEAFDEDLLDRVVKIGPQG